MMILKQNKYKIFKKIKNKNMKKKYQNKYKTYRAKIKDLKKLKIKMMIGIMKKVVIL